VNESCGSSVHNKNRAKCSVFCVLWKSWIDKKHHLELDTDERWWVGESEEYDPKIPSGVGVMVTPFDDEWIQRFLKLIIETNK